MITIKVWLNIKRWSCFHQEHPNKNCCSKKSIALYRCAIFKFRRNFYRRACLYVYMSLQIGFVIFCTLQNLSTTIVVMVLLEVDCLVGVKAKNIICITYFLQDTYFLRLAELSPAEPCFHTLMGSNGRHLAKDTNKCTHRHT